MLLRFENKYAVSLHQLIEKAEKIGGIPSRIEISMCEAMEIIEEINRIRIPCTDNLHNGFTYKQGNSDARLLFIGKHLTVDDMKKLAGAWERGELSVSYEDVPIRIVIKPLIPTKN